MDPNIIEINLANRCKCAVRWTDGGNKEFVVTIPIARGDTSTDIELGRKAQKILDAAMAIVRELDGSRLGAPVARATIVSMCYERLWGRGYGREQVADIAERIADPLIAWLAFKANS
jgi:hypothetical protein